MKFMKSIVRNTLPKKVLGINIPADKQFKLVRILNDYNVVLENIDNKKGKEQVGYLCGFKGFLPYHGDTPEIIADECLIFSGVDNKEINGILKQMRENNAVVELKAVVTAHNQRWTLKQLVTEITNEHKVMHGDKNE